jgi:molecular chaperone GrpE
MQDENEQNGGKHGGNGADDPAATGAVGADSAVDAPAETPADRVAELEAENAALRERALRALADAENTRKRTEREAVAAREYAIERFAQDLLKVADNLSRALSSLPADAASAVPESVRNLLAGVEMTELELMRVFERHKITLISPKGEPFDPNLHQAVAQFPSEVPAGRVAEVMQTGYRLGDRVLRAAMVAVSTGPAGARPGEGQGASGANADLKI